MMSKEMSKTAVFNTEWVDTSPQPSPQGEGVHCEVYL